MTVSYSPLPPTHCHYAITNNTTTNMFQIFIHPQQRGNTREAFPPFGQFLEHIHHRSFTRCLCKSTSRDCKNDFLINSQRTLKLSGVLYIIWRGGKRVAVQKYKPVKQMLKSLKSASLVGPGDLGLCRGRGLVCGLLKSALLLLLGHLAFVLLQSSLQMLIFFFRPGC